MDTKLDTAHRPQGHVQEEREMDDKTRAMVREWVKIDRGDVERTAQWMRRTLRIGPIGECREMVATAMGEGKLWSGCAH